MMLLRVAWLTDIHFNFVPFWDVTRFIHEIDAGDPAAVIITGDIAESMNVTTYLQSLHDGLRVPIFFVLGNHDFYHSSVAAVREQVESLCARSLRLHYLTSSGVLEVAAGVGLVGHDGWADGRLGDYGQSSVEMNDNRLIDDLRGLSKLARRDRLQELADEGASHIGRYLAEAAARYPRVWVATHVPPFLEACRHEGQISDDDWSPHFTCKAVGDTVLNVAERFPHCHVTVLCGHTHGAADVRIRPNLRVMAGAAEYGCPQVTGWLVPDAT